MQKKDDVWHIGFYLHYSSPTGLNLETNKLLLSKNTQCLPSRPPPTSRLPRSNASAARRRGLPESPSLLSSKLPRRPRKNSIAGRCWRTRSSPRSRLSWRRRSRCVRMNHCLSRLFGYFAQSALSLYLFLSRGSFARFYSSLSWIALDFWISLRSLREVEKESKSSFSRMRTQYFSSFFFSFFIKN